MLGVGFCCCCRCCCDGDISYIILCCIGRIFVDMNVYYNKRMMIVECLIIYVM